MSSNELLKQALFKGFIDKDNDGSKLDPKFIINQPEDKKYFLNVLQDEMDSCQTFTFSVAFVTQDGLNGLKSHLLDLAERGIRGRLLTSTYLGFNDPYTFESLLQIPNLDVRISGQKGFHPKGYLFDHQTYQSFVIGSSNLTMNAMKVNYEWNVLLTTQDHGEVISDIRSHLEKAWEEAQPLTSEWIAAYKQNYRPQERAALLAQTITEEQANYALPNQPAEIIPNKMQEDALTSLAALRAEGAQRGLVVSATGTGKTYLAAFDVKQFQPKRMLFIVHREQILHKARNSFQRIIGGPDSDYGVLSGNDKDLQAKYLFATIQSISRDAYLQQFTADNFDYILIDEVHKAGANSYVKVIDYFKPKFLLGMTATPERTDNFNIYELFDYNIAYEIRLQEALDEDLLCPFHYFGAADYDKDGETITETTDLQHLVNQERVEFLLEKIAYYGCSRNNPKGLIFCSRKDEAQALCALFNQQGIESAYLTGEHSIEEREAVVAQLESGQIHYIFTVDIFNEGIDIPKINQVVMLRNTQSSIIFIQQLGRGLRKDDSKDFVTIIDFIGNYKNNYMIPMALAGDNSRNKSELAKDTFDTTYISGISSVNFEAVVKERIYKSIDALNPDDMKALRDVFQSLKNRLKRVPYLQDYLKYGMIDPMIIANKDNKSYYDFLVRLNENEDRDNGKYREKISIKANKMLIFFSRELLPGMRRQELILLKVLLKQPAISQTAFHDLVLSQDVTADDQTLISTLRTLSLNFYAGKPKETYAGAELISYDETMIQRSSGFEAALQNKYFRFLFQDLLKTAWEESKAYRIDQPLTLYKKYRRRDTLRLLNWQTQMIDLNISGYTYKDNKFVIFMALDKIVYKNEILDPNHFLYYTKSNRNLNSNEVTILQNPNGWKFYIFAQKSRDDDDFYYMGQAIPIRQSIKLTKNEKNQNIVSSEFLLKNQLENKFYRYLIDKN
ncbi:MAG: DEAD/DEAH box helicase [Lactobacillus sp.]|jgi:superfamily II DNA or RNA helicase/HKD family nuclease|nr:DEAD/DEAH box helicase [Lactobacillus sp.]